jgi:hypothetical protein
MGTDHYRYYTYGPDGIKTVQSVGEPFGGKLSEALGCQPERQLIGEFGVYGSDGAEQRVCREHLAHTVRQRIVETGCGTVVTDASVNGGKCQFWAE